MATTYPKYQTCPHCKQQVPTQWERRGNEVELPGIHKCPKGHTFLTQVDPRPGDETFDVE